VSDGDDPVPLRIPPADKPLAAVLPSEPPNPTQGVDPPLSGPQEALHGVLGAPVAAPLTPLTGFKPRQGPTPYPHVKEEP
jgi:hypothetical protein